MQQVQPDHISCWTGSLSAISRLVLIPVPCLLQLSRMIMCLALSSICVASYMPTMRSPIWLAYTMTAANTCATGVYAALALAYSFHYFVHSIACLFVWLFVYAVFIRFGRKN